MIATCELCERPAVWQAITSGQASLLCDNHRHAGGVGTELDPLRRVAGEPERVGRIVRRLIDPTGRRRRLRMRPFRPDR